MPGVDPIRRLKATPSFGHCVISADKAPPPIAKVPCGNLAKLQIASRERLSPAGGARLTPFPRRQPVPASESMTE
jgi:hypothetical protein